MTVHEIQAGSESKGDCLVFAWRANERSIEVLSKNHRLLAPGIQAVAAEALDRMGTSDVAVRVQEFGAPDYVIEARIETAARGWVERSIPSIAPGSPRPLSDRHRPRRSRLYAPGNNPRLLAGIDVHGADCVLLDLEDAVPPSEKDAARILVKHLLAAVAFPEEVWVRINPLDGGGRDDLVEVLQGRPHGVCLPKAESAGDVRELAAELVRIERQLGLGSQQTWIMPIIETARGLLRSEEIASADERVVIVAFGAEDYTRDIGARRTPEALLFARSRIVAAAKAAGVQASDTVYADLADLAGLYAESCQARDLGFDGKGAINPRQISEIHRAFSPTEEEIEGARAIVAAAQEAEEKGLGVVVVEGRMVDRPVVERAKRLLKSAKDLTREAGS